MQMCVAMRLNKVKGNSHRSPLNFDINETRSLPVGGPKSDNNINEEDAKMLIGWRLFNLVNNIPPYNDPVEIPHTRSR